MVDGLAEGLRESGLRPAPGGLEDVFGRVRRLAGRVAMIDLDLADRLRGLQRPRLERGTPQADGDERAVHRMPYPVLAVMDRRPDRLQVTRTLLVRKHRRRINGQAGQHRP